MFWDHGAKKGNLRILCLMTCFLPIAPFGVLQWINQQAFPENYQLACCLVTIGVLIGLQPKVQSIGFKRKSLRLFTA